MLTQRHDIPFAHHPLPLTSQRQSRSFLIALADLACLCLHNKSPPYSLLVFRLFSSTSPMSAAVLSSRVEVIPSYPSSFASNSNPPSPSSPPSLTSPTFPRLIPDPSHAVSTTLFYSSASSSNASGEKWRVNINDTKDTNIAQSPTPSLVYDLRGQEASTHIDVTGFQALTSPSTVPADVLLHASDEEVRAQYYPEVERLLLQQTGASRVVFFDHTIRKHREGEVETPQTRRPVQRVHVDQTPASAHVRVTRHVQPPVPYKRFQLINVWRPIGHPVYDFPLGVCDFRTVDVNEDMVPTTLQYPPPTPNGETFSVKWNETHRWYYWSQMTPSDVLLLKCYDSSSRALAGVKTSGAEVDVGELRDVAGLTPHTAFRDEEGAKLGPERQSIEVRALVFYD